MVNNWAQFLEPLKASKLSLLIVAGAAMFLVIGGLAALSHLYTLNGIKSRTVGDGQHGTARWATDREIRKTFAHVPFKVNAWRQGKDRPSVQGLVLGCKGNRKQVQALVDSDDIHCLMIGASGVGKTAFFLYPNIEYACASGMSYFAMDTKGVVSRVMRKLVCRHRRIQSAGGRDVLAEHLQMFHAHVHFTVPLSSGHVPQPGTDQH